MAYYMGYQERLYDRLALTVDGEYDRSRVSRRIGIGDDESAARLAELPLPKVASGREAVVYALADRLRIGPGRFVKYPWTVGFSSPAETGGRLFRGTG